MKLLKCLVMGVAVLGLLGLTSAQADTRTLPEEAGTYMFNHGHGDLEDPGGPRALGNNCGDVEDVGTLPGGNTVVPYSVAGYTDDFDEDFSCPAPCGWYGDSIDGVLMFQVSVAGSWTISACADANDNSLQLRQDGACPGDTCVASDDDSCGGSCAPPYQAEMTVTLEVSVQYYLIVEFGIGNLVFAGPCTDDSQCDDGEFCNGTEVCDAGSCLAGPTHVSGMTVDCEYYQGCDEVADACVDPDPCLAYLSGLNDYGFMPLVNLAGYAATHIADDIFLQPGLGDDLLWYYTEWYTFGPDYTVNMTLHNNTDSLICWDDWATPCVTDSDCPYGGPCGPDDFPGTLIPGSECSVFCPAGGLCGVFCDVSAAGITLPGYFWIVGAPTDLNAGPLTAEWYARIGWSYNYMGAGPDGVNWVLWWFGPDSNADMYAEFCVEECGRCCLPGGGCVDNTEDECTAAGGTSWTMWTMSDPVACEDPDGDGVYTFCDGDNCPDDYNPGQENCNGDAEGDACEGDWAEQDDDGDGECNGTDGCPDDPNKTDPGVCGCGIPDTDTDGDGAEDCIDPCPYDPLKFIPGTGLGQAPGQCGCGNPDTDSDGDGCADCRDCCPGVDDWVYCPEYPCSYPDCGSGIPTVSEWGVVILVLLLLAAGKVYFSRRRATC